MVVFFGFLRAADKGFEDLLDAFAGMRANETTLAVVGGFDEGTSYERALLERIDAAGLKDRICWLGYLGRIEVARWLRAADAVALPFREGARPNRSTLVAALVNGAAVVTTRGAATPDYLVDGETALLVPPSRPDELAAAIERLLEDSSLRARLREGATALSPRLSWPRVVQQLLAGDRT